MTNTIKSERLLSLDVLRGLVLFMLVFFQPLLWSIGGVVESLSYGLAQYLGDWYKVWVTFGNFAIVFFILWILHKNRVFIRV